eukprot:Gb_33268 [translate_table: standard]
MSFTRYNPSEGNLSSTTRKYDVFLSFRGEDVRKTFVDHLYNSLDTAGVNAFLDSQKLNKGDDIGSIIQEAIENSAIQIPVFSRNYAQSHWCLDEVSQMCKSLGLVIPLFYDVLPSDVRYPDKAGSPFAEAFQKHKNGGRYTEERIAEWKSALYKVSSSSGWSRDDTSGFEAGLVKLVVQDVFKTLQNVRSVDVEPMPSDSDSEPAEISLQYRNEPLRIAKSVSVVMEERMNEVIKMLKTDSEDKVLTLGIWGIGGVGKTSLAKAVYNSIYLKFEAACFVYDVRHKAQRTNGLCKIQRQILKDLIKYKDKVNDEAHGKSLMKDHLRSIKALVILEYVDDCKQLDALRGDWFGPGSRVIVTTLDPDILKAPQVDLIYQMEGLDNYKALQLFSWHAFLRSSPDKEYAEMSTRVVSACKGLPFALEVLGAHLYQKDVNYWVEALERLESSPNIDIYASHKISYDALNTEEKEMFLDMACLFIGRQRESAISFWEATHLAPNVGLMNLILKSLIRLDEDDTFVMHSQLRDMGRMIVAGESIEPGERSRLWKPEEVERVVLEGKGTERVRCLTFLQQDVLLRTDYLGLMQNLQLLWLDGATIEGDFAEMPQKLKWLRWENCPLKRLPSEWNPMHLAVLNLSFSKHIESLWNGSSIFEGPKFLKVLKLNYCTSLLVLPDFTHHTSLLRLELCGCRALNTVPESIGFLKGLKHLDLSNCESLLQLPDSITRLCSLEGLFLSNCHGIKELPTSIGELKALRKIRLDGMSAIKELPRSFRWLSCLEKLNLKGCHRLKSLPSSIGELNCLRDLNIHGCSSLRSLPPSIYELECLRHLDMTACKNIYLGEELGNLVCLEKLILSDCPTLSSVPKSIGELKFCLRYVDMSNCQSLFRLPEEFGNLVCLEQLFLNKCYNLYEFPENFGNLSKLRILEMEENYSLTKLPASFCSLTSLEHLKAGGCGLPQQIGDCSSLEVIHLKSYKFSSLPESFSTLVQLNKLYLHHCTELLELPPLPKELIEVDIQDCFGLNKISNMAHMKRLKRLTIHNCGSLVELPDFGSLQSLQYLFVTECKGIKRTITGVEGLKSLRKIHVAGCSKFTLNPRRLIKATPCLELFNFSANGVPRCLQHKMLVNENDLLYVPWETNDQCTGVVLCLVARFKRNVSTFTIAMSITRDGMEIFNSKFINYSKNVDGDQLFVRIFRRNHPFVMLLESGDVIHAKAETNSEKRLIKDCGMQLFCELEEGAKEDLILESMGRDLTLLNEKYNENLHDDDDED